MDAFYSRQGETLLPSSSTRGPWDEGFQHGGPPSALLLHHMTAVLESEHGETYAPARLTTEFLRPVPIAPLRVEVEEPVGGKRVKRLRARLIAERTVLEATGLYLRQDPDVDHPTRVRPGTVEPEWTPPEELERLVFSFFRWEEAYHRAIDVRVVDPPWGTTPIRCWARPLVPLIDELGATPEEATVLVADAESGMGPPVDPTVYSFLNPDLTVYFGRRPRGDWIGYDIRSRADGAGVGLSESGLRDREGFFGRSAQSLVVARQ